MEVNPSLTEIWFSPQYFLLMSYHMNGLKVHALLGVQALP